MRELRTLKRTRAGSRVRSVQGRLSIEFGDEDEVGGEPAKAEPPARSSGFRRPAKSSGTSPDKLARPRGRPSARFSTHWLIAAWWRTGPSNGASSGGDAPTNWKRPACPGETRRPQAFVEIWHKIRAINSADVVRCHPIDVVDLAEQAQSSLAGGIHLIARRW